MFNENVKAKNCLWCDRKVARKGAEGRINCVVCPECKEELKRIRVLIGREEWLKLIKENGIAKDDIFSCYADYLI